MNTKVCTNCGATKPISEFHKDRCHPIGYKSQCKVCIREYYTSPEVRERGRKRMAAYRATPKGKEAMRRRSATEAEKERKKAYKKTPAGKASARRYNRSKKGRAAMRRHRKKYKDDPEYQARQKTYRMNYLAKSQTEIKRAAKRAINHAVEAGNIPSVTEQVCKDCGEQAEHYHHESYKPNKWTEVVPLCHNCHMKRHRVYS